MKREYTENDVQENPPKGKSWKKKSKKNHTLSRLPDIKSQDNQMINVISHTKYSSYGDQQNKSKKRKKMRDKYKKNKRLQEMIKLRSKHRNLSALTNNPLPKLKKRKLHEAGNFAQEMSHFEKRPRINDEGNSSVIKNDARRKKKKKRTKAIPVREESIRVAEVQFDTPSQGFQHPDSGEDYDETGDADDPHDPDPEGEHLSTGNEVQNENDPDPEEGEHLSSGDANEDASVSMDDEEKAVKRLQKRNELALELLRSSDDICKELKEIVPEACLNLPSEPNDDIKSKMLNKFFDWPDIAMNEFPILHKVMSWIFTKESFLLPGKYLFWYSKTLR